MRATGATVSGPERDLFSDSATQRQFIVNDGEWHTATFWIRPNPDADIIEFTISGKGVDKAQVTPLYPPTYKYYRVGETYECQPPTANNTKNDTIEISSPIENEFVPWPNATVGGTHLSNDPSKNIYLWVHRLDCQPGACDYFPFEASKINEEKWIVTNVEVGDCENDSKQELIVILTDEEFPRYDEDGQRYSRKDTAWLNASTPFDIVVVTRNSTTCPS